MARKPDAPCSGCGKMLWGGATSLPPGGRTCRSCRRLERCKNCAQCGASFERKTGDYCSVPCANRGKESRNPAGLSKRELQEVRSHRRRATLKNAASERYSRQEIADRDGWSCGICAGPVSDAVSWPDPESASVDHIVPLSRGGDDTRANVQLAHLRCNLSKGVGAAGSQLRLVG